MTDFARSPFRLDLDQQKKRARDLQRAIRAGNEAALGRFNAAHPRAALLDESERGRLSEAQFVIAREFGLPSWAALKAHILALRQAGADSSVLDDELRTLHIRCGWDISQTLRDGGFTGTFLEYSNPFCQGPVVEGPGFLERRADFIATAYDLPRDEALVNLRREEQALAEAAGRYDRIVIWSEHDTYDQLILLRLLSRFAESKPRVLDLVAVNHFPGGVRFIGLGQLPPDALRLLWQRRRGVTAAQYALGEQAWRALAAADPTALADLATRGTPALPDLAAALRRHLAELPATGSGLSLTQRFILESLRDGIPTVGRVFADLMSRREPLPWLGDLMFWAIVRDMGLVALPPFLLSPDEPWPNKAITLTEAGRRLLDGGLDWLTLAPPERWVGGVRIGDAACWRWDGERPVR